MSDWQRFLSISRLVHHGRESFVVAHPDRAVRSECSHYMFELLYLGSMPASKHH